MKRSVILLAAWALTGLAMAAAPREETYFGSRRGAFLVHGVGARAVGMGEAFTALADDATGGFWNPGGLGRLDSLHATAMYDVAGQGVGLSYLAGALPAGPGVAGASFTMLSFGDVLLRDGTGVKLGTQGLTDFAVTASYALPHPGALGVPGSTGISLEVVNETAAGAVFGGTIGSSIPVGSRAMVGWVVQHLSPPASGFTLPAAVKVGGAFDPVTILTAAADVGVGLAHQGIWISGGLELRPTAQLALRTGYQWRSQDLGVAGLAGLTAGLGFRLGRFGLDYAFQPHGDLATSHRVAIVYGLAGTASGNPVETAMRQAEAKYRDLDYDAALSLARGVVETDPRYAKAWQLIGNILYAKRDWPGAIAAWEKSLAIEPDNARLREFMERTRKESKARTVPARKPKAKPAR